MDPAGISRRFPWAAWAVATLCILAAAGFHLMVDFRGLSTAAGMEQAQTARELARGNGLSTRMHRPLLLANQVERTGASTPGMRSEKATMHGPLGPVLNSSAIRLSGWEFPVDGRYRIYFPDRVIAAVSIFCLLAATGVIFLITARLFDTRIAAATVAVVLVSELIWRLTQSGLPHLLAMFLFALALRGLLSGLERWRMGQIPLAPLLGSAVCFGLLILTLPVAIGLVFGAIAFVIWTFRKRFLIPTLFAITCFGMALPWMFWSTGATGNLFGGAFFQLYESWAPSPGSRLMRTYEPGSETLMEVDLARKLWRVGAQHFESFWSFVGGSIPVLLFFLAFLHGFKNPDAARLRWGILMMWAGAGLTMGLVGTPEGALDPNQIHILFVPIAVAFGLAYLTVLWSRVPLAQNPFSLWRNAHLLAAVGISAFPLLSELPGQFVNGVRFHNRMIHWPPYDPAAVAHLQNWTEDDHLIFSDVPWAVAWYADRHSVWLPAKPPQFESLAQAWEAEGGKVAGIYLTPQSLNGQLASDVMDGDYREWSRVLMRGQVMRFGVDLLEVAPLPLTHWRRLSPTRKDEAWFISSEPFWHQ